MTIDPRDLQALRDEIVLLKEDNRSLHREMALYQQGCKERFDAISVLLARLEAAVVGRDVG